MSIWRDSVVIRILARRLPPWVKRPARRLIKIADRMTKYLNFIVAAGLEFPTAKIVLERETIILIVHEATRTGAPILAWNLVSNLQKKYNTVVLLRRGGAIQSSFEAIAAAVIYLPDHFRIQAV